MATLIKTITIYGSPSVTDANDWTAATNGTSGGEEEFEAKINAADGRWHIAISNASNSTPVKVHYVQGDYVGAKSTLMGSVTAGSTCLICFDSSACKFQNGKVKIRLVPAAQQSLAGANVALQAVEFVPVETK